MTDIPAKEEFRNRISNIMDVVLGFLESCSQPRFCNAAPHCTSVWHSQSPIANHDTHSDGVR